MKNDQKNRPHDSRMTPNQAINIPKLQQFESSFIPIGKNALKVPQFRPFVQSRTQYQGDFIVIYTHYW